MAISKKVIGPRQAVLAMQQDGECIFDKAIDLEKSNLKEYWDSYFDMKNITTLPGERCTVFTIKGLTRRQKEYSLQFRSDESDNREQRISEMADWYIRCGLIGVSNYQIVTDGIEQAIDSIELKPFGQYGDIVSLEWLDKIDFTVEKIPLWLMIRHISEAGSPLSVASVKPSGQT